MKIQLTVFTIAALLTIGSSLIHAEDAPARPAAEPTGAQNEVPATVPRPSVLPKATEAARPAEAAPAPRRARRHVRRHYRHYVYWAPFPIYLPHFHRHYLRWSGIPWFGF